MIALLQAYKLHLLKLSNFKQNIISGFIVGIVSLPLSMAFAIASGTTPVAGIYTAIIACFVGSVFGGTQVQITGPTGAFVIILSGITAQYGFIGLQCTTILAGILLLVMGILRLGSIVKFISYPVIVGFTAGIGFVIFVGQWKSFLGLSTVISPHASMGDKMSMLIKDFSHFDTNTTLLACISLTVYLLSQRYIKKIPASLITLLVSTGLLAISSATSIATIGSEFGVISNQLPTFHIPDFTSVQWTLLFAPACTIALLGAIESLLSAMAIDAMVNSKHNSNQELIGQGMANIVTPFFGGFAATGAIARTIVNIRNGGNSPIAGIVHSMVLLLILYFFADCAAYIPLCALATILFVVAYNMSDIHQFTHILFHAPWYDATVLVITCLLTIMMDLVVAVIFGCIVSIILFYVRLYQTSYNVQLSNLWQNSTVRVVTTIPDHDTVHFKITGPIFFGVADQLEQAFASTNTNPKNIIFDFQAVPFIDITGLTIFYKVIRQYHQAGVLIYIEHVNGRVMKKMHMMHIDQWIEKFQ